MQKVLPLAVALLTVALAGCSDELPSGEFSYQGHAIAVAGSATNAYTAFNDPIGSQDPSSGTLPFDCQQDGLPAGVGDDQKCTQPETMISLVLAQLPDPQGKTFSAYLVDTTGVEADKLLGTLTADAGGAYSLNFTEAVDYSTDHTLDRIEVRLDAANAVVVGYASSAEGSQDFMVNEATVNGIDFDATWKGKAITVSASGLSSNFSYEGWLVSEDGTHAENFPISNGETEYTAEANIDKFTSFHIHVAGTKVNVAVGSIA